MTAKKTSSSAELAIVITLIIAFSTYLVITGLSSSSSSCSSSITYTSPSPAPFTVNDIGADVQFTYDSRYSPHSYPSRETSAPFYPDFDKPGYGFFMAFPDGRFTWDLNPTHEFAHSGIHRGVLTEVFKIKDDGDPPASFESNIDACNGRPEAHVHAPNLLGPSENIRLDYSKPLYAGVRFTEIVSYGHMGLPGTGTIEVTYDSTRLTLINLVNEGHLGLSISRNDPGYLTVDDPSIKKDEQKTLLIQFVLNETTCIDCRCDDVKIDASFTFNNGESILTPVTTSRKYGVLACGPYDPCFFELPDFCADDTPEDFVQEVCSFFYENGDPTPRDVTFEFETSSNLEIIGLNARSKAEFKVVTSSSLNQFKCESRGDLGGVKGHLSHELAPIHCLELDMRIKSAKVGEDYWLKAKSTYNEIAPANHYEIKGVLECQNDSIPNVVSTDSLNQPIP